MGVAAGEFAGGGKEALAQLGRGQDGGVRAPAQDVLLDFFEAAQAEAELGAAIGEFLDLLAGMPAAAAQDVGEPGVHFDDDVVVALAAHDAEAGGEVLAGIEAGGDLEFVAGDDDVAHAAQDEGAEGAALEVVGQEVPAVAEFEQVVGVDAARFGVALAGFAVVEAQGQAVGEGAGDLLEEFEVGVFGRKGAKGEDFVKALQGEAFVVVEAVGETFEGQFEGFFQGGAAVMFEGFVGDADGEELAGADGDDGQARDGGGQVIAVALFVVFDGQFQVVAHAVQVARDGAGGNFKFGGDGGAVGVFAVLEEAEDFLHAAQGAALHGAGLDGAAAGGPGSAGRGRRTRFSFHGGQHSRGGLTFGGGDRK